jgi:hypothetical protein
MAPSTKIHWHLVFMAAFGILVLLVLAFVLFVAFYSHLMDPAHDQAYYSEFAQKTGVPFVFFFAPLPIFLLVRWVGRKAKSNAMTHAVLIIAINLLLDVTITTLAGQAADLFTLGHILAQLAKLTAALLGGWAAQRESAEAQF